MSRLSATGRILTVIAALLLLGVYRLPLWRIDLEAPQYPEGIGMLIRINTVEGIAETDLGNINSLNHYIGMKEIHAESIPELRVMPWIVAVLIVGGLAAAAWGRRRPVMLWTGAVVALGIAGLADFWRWGYDYGHNLDPQAIIKVPGMSYQPPVIGSKELLNFTAHSWPSTGTMLIGVSLALAVAALWLSRRQQPALAGAR